MKKQELIDDWKDTIRIFTLKLESPYLSKRSRLIMLGRCEILQDCVTALQKLEPEVNSNEARMQRIIELQEEYIVLLKTQVNLIIK